MIHYAIEPLLGVDEFTSILQRSTLAERRPVGERQRLEQMLRAADLIATARLDTGLLVGIARSLTDFTYVTYLSDLAVDEAYQRQGIGKQLIAKTHQAAGTATRLVLLAAPAARDYYPHIGMKHHDSCWMIDPY